MIRTNLRRIRYGLFAMLVLFAYAGQAEAVDGERFEVTSIKAPRAALVETIAALQKGDIAGAEAAFDNYDSLWNGIEMYINTRSRDTYQELEHGYQERIEKGLSAPNPNAVAVLAEAQGMLARYDQTIDMVAKGAPLNPIYDDLARLRIVRAHLREVIPALRARGKTLVELQPNNLMGPWLLASAYAAKRMRPEVVTQCGKVMELLGGAFVMQAIAVCVGELGIVGETARARQLLPTPLPGSRYVALLATRLVGGDGSTAGTRLLPHRSFHLLLSW